MTRIAPKTYLTLLWALIFVSPLLAQVTESVAPIKWQRYVNSDANVSINFPKLPLKLESEDACFEQATTRYFAYGAGSVYELSIVKKKVGRTSHCYEKKKFDRTIFDQRRKELSNGSETATKKIEFSGKPAEWFRTDSRGAWLVDDLANHRFFEVVVYSYSNGIHESLPYFNSFEISSKERGLAIGDGALTILGDPEASNSIAINTSDKPESPLNDKKPVNRSPLRIIAKPKARYTDFARQNNEQGAVTLRLTFLANGAIGSISVVSGLAYGLTEQAIDAARKVVFLPAQVNGKPQTVTKTFQYGFSIY